MRNFKPVLAVLFSLALAACSKPNAANEPPVAWAAVETAVPADALKLYALTPADLAADPAAFRADHFIEEWGWLTGGDVAPLAVTAMGDLVFKRKRGEVVLLDTSSGDLVALAPSPKHLEARLTDPVMIERVFRPALIAKMRTNGAVLAANEVYSITKPVNRGGTRTPDNYLAIDMDVHFVLMGQVYRQLKNAPGDAEVGTATITD